MAEVRSSATTIGVADDIDFLFDANLPPGRSVGDTMIAIVTSDDIILTDTNPNYDWEELLNFYNADQACMVLYRTSTLDAADNLQVELNGSVGGSGDYRVIVVATYGRAYVAEALTNGTGGQGGGGYSAVSTSPIDVGLEDGGDFTFQVVSVDGSSTFPSSVDLGTPTGTYNDGGTGDAWAYWIAEVSEYTIDLPARDGHVRAAVRVYSRALTRVPGTIYELESIGGRSAYVEDSVPQYGAAQMIYTKDEPPFEAPSDHPDDIKDVLKTARTNMVAEADLPWPAINAPLYFETEYNGGVLGDPDAEYETMISAVANRWPTLVSPKNIYDYAPDGRRFWSPELLPEWPEGVIGWEWPDGNNPGGTRPAILKDVQVNVDPAPGNYADGDTPESNNYTTLLYAQTAGVTFGEFGLLYGLTGWAALGGSVVKTWVGPDPIDRFSIWGHLNDDLECLLWVMTPVVIEAIWPGVVPPNADSADDYTFGNHPTYGDDESPPDAFFWIYDTPPFVWLYEGIEAPRRITGRGDAMMGGAKRIYPTPRSRQRSNRIAGDFV